jgi:hypothetical protein
MLTSPPPPKHAPNPVSKPLLEFINIFFVVLAVIIGWWTLIRHILSRACLCDRRSLTMLDYRKKVDCLMEFFLTGYCRRDPSDSKNHDQPWT